MESGGVECGLNKSYSNAINSLVWGECRGNRLFIKNMCVIFGLKAEKEGMKIVT